MWNAFLESLVILKICGDIGKEIGKLIVAAVSTLISLIVMGIKKLIDSERTSL